MQQGDRQRYFAWQCSDDGSKLDMNPASDGEEWFATALFFAARRWGNGTGIYRYRAEADAILYTMLHKTDMLGRSSSVTNMFNREHKQVVFVLYEIAATFTDPSYHLPAFYELWKRWAAGYENQQQEDRQFWQEAIQTSRDFSRKLVIRLQVLRPIMLTLMVRHVQKMDTMRSALMLFAQLATSR